MCQHTRGGRPKSFTREIISVPGFSTIDVLSVGVLEFTSCSFTYFIPPIGR